LSSAWGSKPPITDNFILDGVYTFTPTGGTAITITAVGVKGATATLDNFLTMTVTLTGGTIDGISANGVTANY